LFSQLTAVNIVQEPK